VVVGAEEGRKIGKADPHKAVGSPAFQGTRGVG
jgi:hypothetical protein